MANVNILAPFIIFWEGGYVNDPNDSGGATKYGVSLNTWKSFGYDKNGDGRIDEKDVHMISESDAIHILKTKFWDKWKADQIKSQSIANLVVDWFYNSGYAGIKRVQELLGLKADGIVGPKTLDAINSRDPKLTFEYIHSAREKFFRTRSKFPIYGKGWLNRNNAIKFGSLTYNGETIKFEG